MRIARRVLLWLIVGLALAAGYPGAGLASLDALTQSTPADPGPPGVLPWLHVEHPGPGRLPYIADPQGRRVILRGAVAAGLVDYWSGSDLQKALTPAPYFPIDPAAYADGACPPNSSEIWIPPLCRNDLTEMRQLGFNVVRLALSWSLLEPQRGRISGTYLDRIAQVVGWASEERIYVLLDMHSNAYSRYIGSLDDAHLTLPGAQSPGLDNYDGAPAWATFPDFLPSEKFRNQRELNPAFWEAQTSFWLDRDGIQDEYIAAVAALARRFKNDSTVVGYSFYNEPWPGWSLPPYFDDLQLYPFYRRLIDALAGAPDSLPCPALAVCGHADLGVHDRAHLFFVEPGDWRQIADFPTHFPVPLSSYPNLVLSMHAYTHVYTPDALTGHPSKTSPPYDQSYAWAELEARALRAALFVSEFGNDPKQDQELLVNQLAEQERHQVGSTFWVWKQNCGYNRPWGIYEGVYGAVQDQRCAYQRGAPDTTARPQAGCLLADRERLLARTWPSHLPPGPAGYHYDVSTGSFRISGSTLRRGELVIQLAGAGQLTETVGPGAYQLEIEDGPRPLQGCPYS
ncbi:MAG TPA: cellulase family glycosylhydrolase [Candidatus Dormibacteraeota bacterium]